jgi:mono/diheme cytochrome c family protein/DNA-directed RNA polymerase subunit RPC12/RpoP
MFQFRCPRCQSTVLACDTVAGSKMPCPTCGQRLLVPQLRNQTVVAEYVPELLNRESSRSIESSQDSRNPRSSVVSLHRFLIICAAVALPICILAGIVLISSRSQTSKESSRIGATKEEPLTEAPTAPMEAVPPNQSGSSPLVPDKSVLAKKWREILKNHCYRCHGDNGAAEGGFNYVLDRDLLLARKKIILGDAESSKLYRRILNQEMPPEGEQPRPTEDELRWIRQWIDAGLPTEQIAAPPRPFLRDDDLAVLMLDDIMSQKPRERRFIRYFTLTHLYNAGLSDDELQTYRHALSKLTNSLSWRKEIVIPKPLNPERTVFRIDVRDYSWSPKVWEHIAAAYPYGVRSNSPTKQALAATAACEQPFVRGDWFVATAARPPLYHDLLQLPDSDRELERQLKVNVIENIEQERVARAGFNGSGVSRNNRLIERHELAFGGAYWKSYDFIDNVGRHNLFSHPRGPDSTDDTFEPSGGEIIFNLPNGLQAYMLIDAHGKRIDKGPTAIVSDPRRPDRAVENGLSCMACHSRGIVPKTDQIRTHVEKNSDAFSTEEIQILKSLYPPADRFHTLQEQDSEYFLAAVTKTGSPAGVTEPIVSLVSQFESELDLKRSAAEVGCTPTEFLDHLKRSPSLERSLGALKIPGGTIQRQVFTDSFLEIVRNMESASPHQKDE